MVRTGPSEPDTANTNLPMRIEDPTAGPFEKSPHTSGRSKPMRIVTDFASLGIGPINFASEYPAGTRCLVLEDSSDKSYESIVFITVNDEGNITKLHFVTDSRYHFFTPWK